MPRRHSQTLVLLYEEEVESECQSATLAVARKLRAYLMVADHGLTHFPVMDRETCIAA